MAEQEQDYLTEIARKQVRGMDMGEAAKVFVALAEFQKGGFKVEYEPRKPLELVAKKQARKKKGEPARPKASEFFAASCLLAEMLKRSIRFKHNGEDKLWIVVEPVDEQPEEDEEEVTADDNKTKKRQLKSRRDKGDTETSDEKTGDGSDETSTGDETTGDA